MRKILYLQYTNPAAYPPLEHSSRILADAGWKILFLGTGAAGDADGLRFSPNNDVTVRQLPFCRPGVLQKLHYLLFVLWVLGWTISWRPQWIYASDLMACPVALLLSFLPGIRVVYHEHDSPNTGGYWAIGEPPSAIRIAKFMRLCLWARKKLARRAKICVLPNEQRVERFTREMGSNVKVLCIWNCPARNEASSSRPFHHNDGLSVLYHGSIVPSRLSPAVLNALSMLPHSVKVRVIGYETVGHMGYVRQLREKAFQLGLRERVEFVGTVPTRAELFEWCRKSDVGLAFMPTNSGDTNQQTMAGASNKPFDYLACGLAPLVSDLPDWRAMYVEPGYGLACDPDDPESIAGSLRWFLDHLVEMRTMGERGRQRILAEWNYETQFSPLLAQLTVSDG